MANDLLDLGQKLQRLAARAMEEQMRAGQRYNELMRRFGRGELSAQSAGEKYMRFVRDETIRYAQNFASLSLDYYKALFELGNRYNEQFFRQVLGTEQERDSAITKEGSAPATASPRRFEVDLHAPVGQDAIHSFILENKQPEATEISFLVSDFIGPAGTVPFRPPLEIQPSRFVIGPGEERVIDLRLPIASNYFTAGHRYKATVVVRGYDGLELGLNVEVVTSSGSSDANVPSSS